MWPITTKSQTVATAPQKRPIGIPLGSGPYIKLRRIDHVSSDNVGVHRPQRRKSATSQKDKGNDSETEMSSSGALTDCRTSSEEIRDHYLQFASLTRNQMERIRKWHNLSPKQYFHKKDNLDLAIFDPEISDSEDGETTIPDLPEPWDGIGRWNWDKENRPKESYSETQTSPSNADPDDLGYTCDPDYNPSDQCNPDNSLDYRELEQVEEESLPDLDDSRTLTCDTESSTGDMLPPLPTMAALPALQSPVSSTEVLCSKITKRLKIKTEPESGCASPGHGSFCVNDSLSRLKSVLKDIKVNKEGVSSPSHSSAVSGVLNCVPMSSGQWDSTGDRHTVNSAYSDNGTVTVQSEGDSPATVKDRHFLDVLASAAGPSVSGLPASVTVPVGDTHQGTDPAPPHSQSVDPIPVYESPPSPVCCGPRPIRATTRNDLCDADSEIQSSVTTANPQAVNHDYQRTVSRNPNWTGRNCLHIECSGSLITKRMIGHVMVETISPSQAALIHCCHEDGIGDRFHQAGLDLVDSFTNSKHEATKDVHDFVFRRVLLKSKHKVTRMKAYCLLMKSLSLHPPQNKLPFEWDDVERVLCQVVSMDTDSSCPPAAPLALHYMVSALETELLHRPLTSQRRVMKSVAFKWLSAEFRFSAVKTVLQNLMQSSTLTRIPSTEENSQDRPWMLMSMQRLLNLSIAVSRQPDQCAGRIACEIARDYIHLQRLPAKWLLLVTIRSPLLRMRVAQRILDDYCTSTGLGGASDSGSLAEMLRVYASFEPPSHSLTPPLTPVYDGDGDQETVPDNQHNQGQHHSGDSVEELAMLIWIGVESYLAVTKRK